MKDVKIGHMLLVVCAAAAVASAYGARRTAGTRTVSAEAVAFHGAAELYRNLALHFGKRALICEARYWEAVKP